MIYMTKKIIKIVLHSDKDSNFEKGEEIGLTGEALSKFSYALYEVEFEVEVDMETGETSVISVIS